MLSHNTILLQKIAVLEGPADVMDFFSCGLVPGHFHRDVHLNENLLPAQIQKLGVRPSLGVGNGINVICAVKEGHHDNLWVVTSNSVGHVVIVIACVRRNSKIRLEFFDDAGDGIKLTINVLYEKQDVDVSHLVCPIVESATQIVGYDPQIITI